MESANKKVIVTAIVLALITSLLVYIYIMKVTTKPEVEEYINVYVAAKTLPARHLITDNDLKQAKVTKEYLNTNAVLNKADIIGKRLKDSVIEGEQILTDRLVDEQDLTLSYKVPEGKRAVSINVNEQVSVSYLIRPGDHIDVLASFEAEEYEEGLNRIMYPRVTTTLMQDIEVLAMGQDIKVDTEKFAELPKTVTLAVSPDEAEKLVYASDYAMLRLVLRNADNHEIEKREGVLRKDLVPAKGIKTVPK